MNQYIINLKYIAERPFYVSDTGLTWGLGTVLGPVVVNIRVSITTVNAAIRLLG